MLDDPTSDELADGVNPRLHLALHLIIANQLWEDNPPGCGRPPSGCSQKAMIATRSCMCWPTS